MEEEVRTAPPAFDPEATVAYLAVETVPRSVSSVVKFLARAHPMPPQASHLKRVRRKPDDDSAEQPCNSLAEATTRMQILVGRQSPTVSTAAFPEDVREQVICTSIVHIPAQCPATQEEHAVAKGFWPMSFHDTSKNNARATKGGVANMKGAPNDKESANSFAPYGQDPLSSDALRLRSRRYMRLAIQAAQSAGERVGCVFVDPNSGNVVARSSDPDTTVPPLLSNASNSSSSSTTTTSAISAASRLRKRLRTPVMRCISSIAMSQAETSTRARAVGVALGLQVPDDSAASARKRGKAPETEAYLCTGLDAFVTLEPSPMCAMALLHSRVGRVFYGASDATAGVLGSNGMLHEEKSINHRYRVYRRVLEAECRALLFENPSDAIMAAAADAVKDPADHFGYNRNTKTDPQNKRARLY